MWTYVQSTGELVDAQGEVVARGYAGCQEGKNTPAYEQVRNIGPLPQGHYSIGPPYATRTHGPYVLRLTPDLTNRMYGRAGFLIHGDSVSAPGTASNGCIVLPKSVRVGIGTSGDTRLEVIPVLNPVDK